MEHPAITDAKRELLIVRTRLQELEEGPQPVNFVAVDEYNEEITWLKDREGELVAFIGDPCEDIQP